MADARHVAALQSGVDAWNAWRRTNSEIVPDLRGVDLIHAKLNGLNLDDADLREANLYGADLVNAGLRRANLEQTRLWGVDLTGADLTSATLKNIAVLNREGRRTNFANAILRGVVFTSEADDNDLTGFLELVDCNNESAGAMR